MQNTEHQDANSQTEKCKSGLTKKLGKSATTIYYSCNKAGMSYEFNKYNSFGISGNYTNRDQIRNDLFNKLFFDKNHVQKAANDRFRFDPETQIEKEATAF